MEDCKLKQNPFFFGKFEQEQSPNLYVPDSIVEWGSGMPMLFEGVRGSGKSSVLNLLTWQVSWKMSSVKTMGSRRALHFFSDPKHIGVSHRVEDMDVAIWDRWQVSKNTRQLYFATFLEFLYLDLLIDALINIRKITKTLFVNSQTENEFTRILLDECYPPGMRPCMRDLSFNSLREVIADNHQGIRQLMTNNVSEDDIKRTYSIVAPGSVIKKFGNGFRKCYPELTKWVILILLDDCNFLRDWQVRVINTAVSNSSSPISYKLSSLAGLYPTFETLDETKPLVLDNISRQPLPTSSSFFSEGQTPQNRSQQPYLRFVNHVCKVRLEQYDKKTFEGFDFKTLLGNFNLEDMLAKKLSVSENKDAIVLLEKAKAEAGNGPLSITHTWLHEKNVRDRKQFMEDKEATEATDKKEKRRIASIYERKFNHVAGVSLCRELGIDFPYYGYDVVLHLSAGSIREMLRIMYWIWDKAIVKNESFSNNRLVDQKIQTAGIIAASEQRFKSIDANPISDKKVSLQSICERLGNLFAHCQSYPYILAAAETASIVIKDIELESRIREIIRKAQISGWLLTKKKNDDLWIGLHPILSPKFGISFRNPFYYPERISKNEVRKLFLGADNEAKSTQQAILTQRIGRYEGRYKKKVSPEQKTDLLFDIDPE